VVTRDVEAIMINNTFHIVSVSPEPVVQTYNYYAWNEKVTVGTDNVGQGGRLKSLLTNGGLQNLSYLYYAGGNVHAITDSLNTEIQLFTYDALDRLTGASASGVTVGAYRETYQYDSVSGSLSQRRNVNTQTSTALEYGDASHKHAVSSSGGNSYEYDANGNMSIRTIVSGADAGSYELLYDAENRLVEVKKDSVSIAQFTYDGDGKRVKSVMNGETILFVGGHYEVSNPGSGQVTTKYYFAGAQRVAMRKYTIPQPMTVNYFLGDHLGSTSVVTDATGAKIAEMRYKAWGEVRYNWTSAPATTSPAYKLPSYTYTGQYSYMDDPSTAASEGFGLMYYNARWYDPYLNHFSQPDTIIPSATQGVQAYDRYAYSNNNPVLWT
jgi:RHS repeat-associated protein